ncbi:MAG TPA: PQQ-binding-like beta-propeller repeat protein [Thermoleophilia bacterium]|nr:PQQ-binding-like beta-propeller repeat protein [Thermoleophilia bacterium]
MSDDPQRPLDGPRPDHAARRRQVRRRRAAALLVLVALVLLIAFAVRSCGGCSAGDLVPSGCEGDGEDGGEAAATPSPILTGGPSPAPVSLSGDGIKVASFLGGLRRDFSGLGAPRSLDLIWYTRIGSGWTSGKLPKDPPSEWAGIGWTGQPAVVVEGGRPYLLVGGYDHRLHKIDGRNGDVVWEAGFDDIVKSSPTVIEDPDPQSDDDRYLVLAGSRRGYPLDLDDPDVAPYRAFSLGTGKELWRLPVPQTRCYSRDCDASGLFVGGKVYIGVESGWFYRLDPFRTVAWGRYRSPVVEAKRLLLGTTEDRRTHKRNLVLEASPVLVGQTIFVSAGAGHVYGLRPRDLAIVWDYRVGADLDGTPVPTADQKLLVPVEKQYVKSRGGVLLLDPSRPPDDAVVWFLPTSDRELSEWKGGVLGSVAVNDSSNRDGSHPALGAVVAVDGYLYVFSQDTLAQERVKGPNLEPRLRTPVVVAKIWMGGGITTPAFVDDRIVVAGYDNMVHLYKVDYEEAVAGDVGALPSADGRFWTVNVRETARFTGGGPYEASPVVWDGRVFIGSRDGNLYCLGKR